jgi:hypothetical protein
MGRVSRSLNRVKIALKDRQSERAKGALDELAARLAGLEQSCGQCHQDAAPAGRIFAHLPELFDRMRVAFSGSDLRAQGRLLGELGVTVCARCHSVHRTLGDLRGEIGR